MFKLKHRCLSLLAVLFLAACANVVAPTGGPKDVTPPKVLASQPENHSTGFSGRKVEITFDEYVTLNNASQQVTFLPPNIYQREWWMVSLDKSLDIPLDRV